MGHIQSMRRAFGLGVTSDFETTFLAQVKALFKRILNRKLGWDYPLVATLTYVHVIHDGISNNNAVKLHLKAKTVKSWIASFVACQSSQVRAWDAKEKAWRQGEKLTPPPVCRISKAGCGPSSIAIFFSRNAAFCLRCRCMNDVSGFVGSSQSFLRPF